MLRHRSQENSIAPEFDLNRKLQRPNYDVKGTIAMPSKDFIRETPTFGVHGILGENVAGFVNDYESKGVGKGHFYHMSVVDREMSPIGFALSLNASVMKAIDCCLETRVNEGELSFEERPTLILQIKKPGKDSEMPDRIVPDSDALVYVAEGQSFDFVETPLFAVEHDALDTHAAIKPIVFTEEDAQMASQQWAKFIEGRAAKRLGMSAKEFSRAITTRVMTIRILDELGKEIDARKTSSQVPDIKE